MTEHQDVTPPRQRMCPNCGYALGPFDEECPRCGQRPGEKPPAPSPPPPQALQPPPLPNAAHDRAPKQPPEWAARQEGRRRDTKKWSTKAIVGLCCAIAGLMCCPIIGGGVGIVLSVLAINEGDERHGKISLWVSIGTVGVYVLGLIAYYVFIFGTIAAESW